MAASLLDGKALAHKIREELATTVAAGAARLGRPPGLAVVLVGEDPASKVYVRNKERAALGAGFHSEVIRLPADASQEQVLQAVTKLNADTNIDGFLVQLPLPAGLDSDAVIAAIDPAKDLDGLHPNNLGALLAGKDAPRPCTPSGVMAILDAAEVRLRGAHAVVVGRSTIVGKPMAALLLERDCTVVIAHSKTRNLSEEIGRADIVVAAVGRPKMICADWLKPGATVIDVGINRGPDGLVGDVDFAGALSVAGAITPVPGGVGPMTIAMLLTNAWKAAARKMDTSASA